MSRITLIVTVFTSILLFSCQQKQEENQEKDLTCCPVENHSYSNISEINTTHLHLDITVNFDKKVIEGVARHKMINNGTNSAIFDVKGLDIQKITLGPEGSEQETTFKIGTYNDLLGAPLFIDIDSTTQFVNIYYSTTQDADALDWLDARLTGSGKYPFLYTQGEAILTRSWIPIQDTPKNRFTYTANVKVPKDLLAVMSATNPVEKNANGEYSFQMKQPISSYLLALAVGELEYAKLSDNSGVYAEPYMIKQARDEFKDIPKMISAAQAMYGDYLWEIYDVLVLPYSFPYGGMENPRLTFATPTLIAGDGSLVSVVAHELAHSWSGNLVTNATWNDFWLNEGFTVYFENRIMESVYGKEIADMLALIEFQELQRSVDEMMATGNGKDTRLKLELHDRDPDDGMTDIAYVKGAFLLKTIENLVGREKFDDFLKNYFHNFQFETLTTEEFVAYLNKNLIEKYNVDFDVDEWVYGEGIPANCVQITSERFELVQQLAKSIQDGGKLPVGIKRSDKITQEWLAFIRAFDGKLSVEKMAEIDAQLHFRDSGNAEIMTEWFVLGIQNEYMEIRPEMEAFLIKVGRRKFLEPLYIELAKHSKESREWGKEVYEKARPHYHSISYKTIDKIFQETK
ncbi:MAG: M1 family metallopeptidase [Brumimicrobium sp.]|nr:M1 family metallopeptidase [Brumimicrobium sp.]